MALRTLDKSDGTVLTHNTMITRTRYHTSSFHLANNTMQPFTTIYYLEEIENLLRIIVCLRIYLCEKGLP
jgi:hypothetical protein